MKNSCKPWTSEELFDLDEMVRDGISIRTISKKLGRSENAARNAFRNIIYHQLLDNDATTVAEQYNMTMFALYNDIVDPKYDVSEPPATSSPNQYIAWATLTALVAAGSAYYAHLVMNHW